jgi:hypothetical protein
MSKAVPDPVIDLIGRAVASYFSDVTGRTEPEVGDLDMAFSIHQALIAAAPGTISPVLELHRPIRRYKACFLDKVTYPAPEPAILRNRRDPMRGYESIVLTGIEDVPFVEVCAECSRIENFDQGGDGYGDDHDDHRDGTELSVKASAWPCATYAAVTGVR